jgi:hypothetical protein
LDADSCSWGGYILHLAASSRGKIPVRCLDQHTVMVVHETVSVADPVVAFIDMLKCVQKVEPVLIGFKHGLLFIATGGDVIDSTGIFYAEWTGHEARISKKCPESNIIDLTLKCTKRPPISAVLFPDGSIFIFCLL